MGQTHNTFAAHPDTSSRERAAWDEWVRRVRLGTLTPERRAELRPIIRRWMNRRATDAIRERSAA